MGGANIKTDASNRLVSDTEKSTWNGKANANHTHSYLPLTGGRVTGQLLLDNTYITAVDGEVGKNGYVLMAQIKIGTSYQNAPIEFEIARRNDSSSTFIYVRFLNVNNADPGLASFNAIGSTGAIFIVKSATSTWDIYVQKEEAYGEIGVLSYHKPGYMGNTTVTFPDVFASALPSGYQQVTYTYLPYKTGTIARLEDINKTITDWNTATTSGFYLSAKGASNAPVSDVGITGNVSATGSMIIQTVYPESTDNSELVSYTRKGINNSGTIAWSKWIKNVEYLKSFIIKGYDYNPSSKYYENLFNNTIPSTVTSIYFTDISMPSNATLIDVDEDGDGGVVAWLDTSDNTKMYISTQHSGTKVEGNSNIGNMFYNKSSLAVLDVSSFDTSKATNMSDMFNGCSSLTTLDVSNFNTSKVTSMYQMFYNCSSLKEIDVSFWDVSNVDEMENMFYNCSSLTTLKIYRWNTSKCVKMNGMFDGCSSLYSLDVHNFITNRVTNMSNMFFGCKKLTELDVAKWDVYNVWSMKNMFCNCNSLTELDVSNWDTRNVIDMNGMFDGCTNLTSLDVSKFNVLKVTDMGSMFNDCRGLSKLDLHTFYTCNVTNMSNMFYNCYSLTSLDLDSFVTYNVKTMQSMFMCCSKLSTLNLAIFNTSKVTDMSYMLAMCTNLQSVNVYNWNTSKVTNMNCMFMDCSNLTSLDLSGWDTSNVGNAMNNMFYGCSKLKTIKLGSKSKFASLVILGLSGYWKGTKSDLVYDSHTSGRNTFPSNVEDTYTRLDI